MLSKEAQQLTGFQIGVLRFANVYYIVIHCGETQEVETACVLNQQLHKLSLTLKPYEHLPVVFEASGTISSKFRGRVKVSLTNYSFKNVKMCAGTLVGYIVLEPFSLK